MAKDEQKAAVASAQATPALTVAVSPLFKLLILVNALLCLVSFAGLLLAAFASHEPMTKGQEQLSAACDTVFKMTAGAFIGLLGGRAGAADRIETRPHERKDS